MTIDRLFRDTAKPAGLAPPPMRGSSLITVITVVMTSSPSCRISTTGVDPHFARLQRDLGPRPRTPCVTGRHLAPQLKNVDVRPFDSRRNRRGPIAVHQRDSPRPSAHRPAEQPHHPPVAQRHRPLRPLFV